MVSLYTAWMYLVKLNLVTEYSSMFALGFKQGSSSICCCNETSPMTGQNVGFIFTCTSLNLSYPVLHGVSLQQHLLLGGWYNKRMRSLQFASSNWITLPLLCTRTPLVWCCDRFNHSSRQVKPNPVDLVMEDFAITLCWLVENEVTNVISN